MQVDGKYTNLLKRFCKMMNFEFKWETADFGKHTLTIANEHTFAIRYLEDSTFPGTNSPTYIDTTYVTPTDNTLEQCCKDILCKSFGRWWTGTLKVSSKELHNYNEVKGFTADGKYVIIDFAY